MICKLCKGAQNLFVIQNKRREWFRCPFCKGVGDITAIDPATISISRAQHKYLKKEKEND